MKIKSGDSDLDEFLEGGYSSISSIYGLPTSGKSCLSLMAVLEQLKEGKKVFFFDVKNDFNLSRLEQIKGANLNGYLDNLFVLKIKSFIHQQKKINDLLRIIDKKEFSLIVIDGFNFYYRTLSNSKSELARKMMNSQLRVLKDISEKVPVIITNDVFENFKSGIIQMVGGEIIKHWSYNIIRLDVSETKHITLKRLKPAKEGNFSYKIVEKGIQSCI